MTESGASGGLLASLRRMFGTVLEMGQVRLHILGNELEQEKMRIFDGVLIAAIGLMLFSVGVVLLCALVVMLFAEGYRIAALAVMTLGFIIGGVFAMRAGGNRLRGKTHMFHATLTELAQDRDALVPREEQAVRE